MNKQMIARILRYVRLLSLADRVYFLKVNREFSTDNRAFIAENPGLGIPPDAMLYEVLGNNSYRGYWESGLIDAKWLSEVVARYRPGRSGLKIIEWGCGPARVIRHMKNAHLKSSCYGFDYSEDMINWCTEHVPDCIFGTNKLSPPLDVESNTFDVFYCISVFTHLSEERHLEWIGEATRVLKPGGLFVGTFHGEKFFDRLLPDEKRRFENGGLVIRGKVEEGSKNYAAYQSEAFLRDRLFKDFVNIEEIEDAPFHQNVWCAEKPVT